MELARAPAQPGRQGAPGRHKGSALGFLTEIDRVLSQGGVVYLLGGTSALSDATSAELGQDGYQVRRLAGDTRVETSLRVAEEVVAARTRRRPASPSC